MNVAGMNGTKPKAIVLDKPRARRDAAKVLAVALQTRYRRFLESAGDDDATVIATGDLAQCMYENIEFIMWALKSVGGMNPPPPEELRKVTPPMPQPVDPRFAKPPVPVLEEFDVCMNPNCANKEPHEIGSADCTAIPCTCPPLEHGIIGRTRHMASCPKFVP